MAAVIIDDVLLNALIDQINVCQKDNGSPLEMPAVDEPGVGNIIMVFIRTIEKGFATNFQPILELKDLILNYLINPPAFIDKILEFVDNIQQMITNPIDFILNQLVEPIAANIKIPLNLDLSAILPGFVVSINQGFLQNSADIQEGINKMITPEFFTKLLEFIIFPIKLIIGILQELIILIIEAVAAPLIKIAELVIKLTTDFQNAIVDIILGVIIEPIKTLLISVVPGGEAAFDNFENLVSGVMELITKILTLQPIDIDELISRIPDLNKVFGLVNIISCLFKSILTFIIQFPVLFFGIGAGDSVVSAKKVADAAEEVRVYTADLTIKIEELQDIIDTPIPETSEEIEIREQIIATKQEEINQIKQTTVSYLKDTLDEDGITLVMEEEPELFDYFALTVETILN